MKPELEQALIVVRAALEQHDAHGWGKFSVNTTPESIAIENGIVIRIPKKVVDKTANTR